MQKSSILDVRLGSKYIFGNKYGNLCMGVWKYRNMSIWIWNEDNVKKRISGTNKYKEQLQYSEKERNAKNRFWTTPTFWPMLKFHGPTPPTSPTPKFHELKPSTPFVLTHAKSLWGHTTHSTYATTWPTPPTPKLYPLYPHY